MQNGQKRDQYSLIFNDFPWLNSSVNEKVCLLSRKMYQWTIPPHSLQEFCTLLSFYTCHAIYALHFLHISKVLSGIGKASYLVPMCVHADGITIKT